MDKRLKKNHKNELLEEIRKIVKEEVEKAPIIPSPPAYILVPVPFIPPKPWQPPHLSYWNPYYTDAPPWNNNTTSIYMVSS